MYRDDWVNWNTENPLGKAVTVAVVSPNFTSSASDDIVIVNVSDDNGTYSHMTSHMTL